MNLILLIAGPFVLFSLLNHLTVSLSKQKFGVCLPLTMMMSSLVMFCSQFIFKSFKPGYAVIIAAAIAGLVFTVKAIREHKADNMFTWGMVAFALIILVFLVVNYNRNYTSWDELSHWCIMVKEMIRTDRFYSEEFTNMLVHRDYPPFISLFEMIWCRVAGGYNETTITMAIHTFMFVLLVPFFAEKISEIVSGRVYLKMADTTQGRADQEGTDATGKAIVNRGTGIEGGSYWLNGIIVCASLLIAFVALFSALDTDGKFNTIMPDLFVAALYGFGIALILDRKLIHEAFGYVALIITCVSLILTKQIAITFILLIWFFYTMLEILDYVRCKASKQEWGFGVLRSILLLIWTVIFYLIWGNYTKSLGIKGQFDFSKISIGGFIGILRGVGTEFQISTRNEYLHALFHYDLFTGAASISYMHLLLFALVLLIILYKFGKNAISLKETLVTGALFIIGAGGYALTLFILYMFCFSEAEMKRLASYQRYMGAYVQGMFLVLLFILIRILEAKAVNAGAARTVQAGALKTEADQPVWTGAQKTETDQPVWTGAQKTEADQLVRTGAQKTEADLSVNPVKGIHPLAAQLLIVAIFTVLLCGPECLIVLQPQCLITNEMLPYQQQAQFLEDTVPDGSKVMVISEGNLMETYYINCYSKNMHMEKRTMYWDVALMTDQENENWKELREYLKENDYVFFVETSDSVNARLASYTDTGHIDAMTIYKVVPDGDSFKLQFVK